VGVGHRHWNNQTDPYLYDIGKINTGMVATKRGIQRRKPKLDVPDYLVMELIDGQPIHYRGYHEVLSGQKQFAEIMGSSTLQSLIITHVVLQLGKFLNEEQYTVLTNEVGIHLDRRNNLAGDVLIFDNETLPINAISENYADVPPKIAIEVDVMADPSDLDPDSYIFKKTQKLLSFGVEKVVWITSQSKKVTIATADADWQVKDWNKDVEVLPGVIINIGQYLTRRGSSFA
jgi:hypothetical protein